MYVNGRMRPVETVLNFNFDARFFHEFLKIFTVDMGVQVPLE
jgi:hypothetical protein